LDCDRNGGDDASGRQPGCPGCRPTGDHVEIRPQGTMGLPFLRTCGEGNDDYPHQALAAAACACAAAAAWSTPSAGAAPASTPACGAPAREAKPDDGCHSLGARDLSRLFPRL
jgi:hypothetical protein